MDTIKHNYITNKFSNKEWFMNTEFNQAFSEVAYCETIR